LFLAACPAELAVPKTFVLDTRPVLPYPFFFLFFGGKWTKFLGNLLVNCGPFCSFIIVTSWQTLPKASTGRQVLIAHLAFNMLGFSLPNLWVFPLAFLVAEGGGKNAFQPSLLLVFAALLSLFKLRWRLKPQGASVG